MKVYYSKGQHVIISFAGHEMKQALGVLQALAKYFKAKFLYDVVEELRSDLVLKLAYDPHYRICEACKVEIDTRKDAYIHQNYRYTHQMCPVLKDAKLRGNGHK